MVIFLYTDKNCEYQGISCIKSLLPRVNKNDKIVYYTIGFDSSFEAPFLQKIRIGYKKYPTFHYYKSELSLMTMEQALATSMSNGSLMILRSTT